MRRLNFTVDAGTHRERGAVAFLTAILMTALLAFGAIAVDGGLLFAERAQLQSGADAAALALAQKCAASTADPACQEGSSLAEELADSNAGDAASLISSLAVDTSARRITVVTGALEAGARPGAVALYLANILGNSEAEVGARAGAVWGSPSAGRTAFPLAFSVCQVQGFVDGGLQLLQEHGKNINADCNYGPSGAVTPGGFGWLVQDAGQCGGSIDVALAEGGSDPGNNAPGNCSGVLNTWASDIEAGKPVTVLLPVFTAVTGTGSSAVYSLLGFAAYSVVGWKFSGDSGLPYTFRNQYPSVPASLECQGNCRGIVGKFITYVSLADGYTLGPVDGLGTRVVRITR
ncbi:pilus assembly protein TadG-related protein [Sinomonas mesophila]|uniref:pilus assembly protein TadG-related protein n=1 Tax=Sinomonas mesophila TaxID=1531955 RepID=UPI001FE7AC4C|nr:pilus assembly protein TadG-related protein [Sinomonas mesophila]